MRNLQIYIINTRKICEYYLIEVFLFLLLFYQILVGGPKKNYLKGG